MNRKQLRSQVVFSLLLAGLLISTVLAGQQPAAQPFRIGATGIKLTDQEVADLIKVLPAGAAPWLIDGDGPGAFGEGPTQRFQVYMTPISATPEVRHGVAMEVSRPIGAPSAWSIVKKPDGETYSFDYAQVAITGRPFDQVQEEYDENRPFILTGGGDDVDLVSFIKFVRSRYTGPIRSVVTRVPDALSDIEFLRLAPGEVRVGLRQNRTSGIQLDLRKLGPSWEVSRKMSVNE